MNRLISCGILLVCLLMFFHNNTACAEEKVTLYPLTTWVFADPLTISILHACAQTNSEEEPFTPFPDEIDLNTGWKGIAVTDGNDQWTIMSFGLHSGDDDTQISAQKLVDNPEFQLRLLEATIITFAFQDGKPHIIQRNNRIYVLSESFPIERLNELNPETHWNALQEKYRSAILYNEIQWTLYPVLPPETENEGSFLKDIRKKRTGEKPQTDDGAESTLLGMNINEQGEFKGTLLTKLRDGLDESQAALWSPKTNLPFGLDGFQDEKEQKISVLQRFCPGTLISKTSKLILKGCVVPLNPDEQEKDEDGNPKNTQSFQFAYAFKTDPIEEIKHKCQEEGWDKTIAEGNLVLATVEYFDDLTDNPIYLEAKAANEALFQCMEQIKNWISPILQGIPTLDKTLLIDFAFTADEQTVMAAVSFPTEVNVPEFGSALKLLESVNSLLKMFHKTAKANKPFPLMSLQFESGETEILDEVEYSTGQITLQSDQNKVPLVAYLSAVKKNELYAMQITTKGIFSIFEFDHPLLQRTDLMDQNKLREDYEKHFKECVKKSLLGKTENRPIPKCFVHLNTDDFKISLDEISGGNEPSYQLTIQKNSYVILQQITKILGLDTFKSFMPF